MTTEHNRLRDTIADRYFGLGVFDCSFCHESYSLPQSGAERVTTEYRAEGWRADIAIWDNEKVIGVIEIIDTHAPTDRALNGQSELPVAWYVGMDALRMEEFTGYCSGFCWTNRKNENAEKWEVPRCEGLCGLPLHTLEYPQTLLDWENPYYPTCLLCAARIGGQWRSPGELVFSGAEDRIPQSDAVVDLFMAFEDAHFWSMVWSKRTREVQEARVSEQATVCALNQVEAAFDAGEWDKGYLLLKPIGAPAWNRLPGDALYAWKHSNCVRTARAWRTLREYRIGCLPSVIQAAIRTRPQLPAVLA